MSRKSRNDRLDAKEAEMMALVDDAIDDSGPALRAPKIAIIGRPNVGKSTIFNRLAGRKLAIVNDTPGVTRDRFETKAKVYHQDITLVDTAGFEDLTGDTLESRMREQTEIAIDQADICLFVLMRALALPLLMKYLLRKCAAAIK